MNHLPLLIFFFVSLTAASQNSCEGLDHLNTEPVVVVRGIVQKNILRKSSLDSNDLFIVVRDTSYHVTGFAAFSECPADFVCDIVEKRFVGNKINRGDPFVRRIRVGNHLSLDCINVEKNGKRFLLKNVYFELVE